MNKKELREYIFKLAKCQLNCEKDEIGVKESKPDKLMVFFNDNAHAGIITEEEYAGLFKTLNSKKNYSVINN